jgi:hypothetical protein
VFEEIDSKNVQFRRCGTLAKYKIDVNLTREEKARNGKMFARLVSQYNGAKLPCCCQLGKFRFISMGGEDSDTD